MRRFEPILTERLRVRRLRVDEAEAVLAYRSDPEVARYQNWGLASVAEVRSFIERLDGMELITPGAWFQLALADRVTDEVVGDCGVHAQAGERRQVELGITLARPFQGRGYATEALAAVFRLLFTRTETHRVQCSVDPENHRCLALLRRLGMRQEAWLRESLWIRGAWADDVIFGLLRRDWEVAR